MSLRILPRSERSRPGIPRPLLALGVAIGLSATLLSPVSPASAAPTTYYVDAVGGNDSDSGTSAASAWKTLDKVNSTSFAPGDSVLFQRGRSWIGQLAPSTSGTAGNRIRFSAFGTGAKPIIDGAPTPGGSMLAAVYAHNVDHLEFSDLELRNDRSVPRAGVRDDEGYGLLVRNDGDRRLDDFLVERLTVTDASSISFNRHFNSNLQASIGFLSYSADHGMKDITIRDNRIDHGSRFGALVQSLVTHFSASVDDTKMQNVVFTGNTCVNTGGSCVQPTRVKNALIENNTMTNPGTKERPRQLGRGSGGWVWNSENVVVQKNTITGARGGGDSSWFHVDAGNTNVLMQYNYSYDNIGYGLEILGGNKNIIVRYNVSIDSGYNHGLVASNTYVPDGPAELSDQLYIYNNTIAYGRGDSRQLPFEWKAKNSEMYNNIFVAENGAEVTPLTTHTGNSGNLVQQNLWNGAAATVSAIDSAPVLASPQFFGGARTDASSFTIQATSPARDAGMTRTHPTFAALGSGLFAGVPSTPTTDFYGNALPSPGGPNIGAGQGW